MTSKLTASVYCIALSGVLCGMQEKFCRLDTKGMERVAALGFDYFSVTKLSYREVEDMGIRKEAGVRSYYFAYAGSRAADEQHRALHEYAGVQYTEKEADGEWVEMAIGSDALADLLNDGELRVWVDGEVFGEEE